MTGLRAQKKKKKYKKIQKNIKINKYARVPPARASRGASARVTVGGRALKTLSIPQPYSPFSHLTTSARGIEEKLQPFEKVVEYYFFFLRAPPHAVTYCRGSCHRVSHTHTPTHPW